jgi:predicted permease
MNLWHKIQSGFRALFRKEKLDREMDEEMRAHIELRTQANIAAGMSPQQARYTALRSFGGMEQVKEICRDLRGVGWIETFWRDVRFGFRVLRKNPGFTALVVATLALGIGANTAIFSFLDRIFLRSLPVKRPHELVALKYRSQTGSEGDTFLYPLYVDFRKQSQETFSELVAYSLSLAALSRGDSMQQMPIMAVSSDYFTVLGVKPVLGRSFSPEEDQSPGAQPVAILSHELWRRQFDHDPAVVGKTIRLDDHSLWVVGIAPAEFTGTAAGIGPAIYVPLATWAHVKGISLEKREYDWLNLLGRLKAGVSLDQAQAALNVLAERIRIVDPLNTPSKIFVADGSRGTNFWMEKGLWWPFALVQAVTALVLLVACANVMNLLLARGITRQKEIAIRVAIGARRSHVIRQLLTESILLALLSGASGVLLAHWLTSVLRSALTMARMVNMPVGVDGRVLAFGLLASLATGLVCGLVPALRASRPNLVSALNEGSGILTAFARRWSFLNLMVVIQVAIAIIVLAFGALCLRSLERLWVADPGFDTTRILAASVDTKRELSSHLGQMFTELRDRVAGYPGVEAVCLAASVPLTMEGRNKTGLERIEQFQMPPDEKSLSLDYSLVSPGFFRTLGVPLLRGRDFTSRDGPGAPSVMIVNELFAHRFWPNQDPIGKHVTVMGKEREEREVIGVVKTVKLNSIRVEPFPLMFWPIDQPRRGTPVGDIKPVLLVRTTGDPNGVASLVRREMESASLDPVVIDVRTLRDRLSEVYRPQRLIAGILNAVGLVGLLFAATGVFGLMAYEVSQRTREIGIRVALGAQRGDVRNFVLRKGAVLTLAGLVLGIGLSLVPIRLLLTFVPEIRQSEKYFLYGVHAWDPIPYAGAALVVVLVALAACWIPARRATRVAPTVALRCE